jgi:hypothetical protein
VTKFLEILSVNLKKNVWTRDTLFHKIHIYLTFLHIDYDKVSLEEKAFLAFLSHWIYWIILKWKEEQQQQAAAADADA